MFGSGELIVILCVVLVLFGGKKLPELARSIGLGIREFKKACHGIDDDEGPHFDPKKKSPTIETIEVSEDKEHRQK